MDGFFERYGRVIIVAVVICFVLLFLTPMRNVVGSSINGFAGNFANKVGESLGTVKMPDGSGGATNSEKVKVGDTLDIEGTKYIVLEERENNQALIMTASSIGDKAIQSNYDGNTGLRPDGQNANTYEGSEIDNYLENDWYNSLSSTMKAAIQTTSIKQASYTKYNDPDTKQETGPDGQVYNTISRHVFLPSISEIGEAVDLKSPDKVKEFLNGTDIWTRDSAQAFASYAVYLNAEYGRLSASVVNGFYGVRPAFVIDLSKVDYTVEEATNYK
ncbi:hypothetical protein KTQ89_09100 [Holdemanella porci]|uniref:DUF6273 domain-containing protein n=1 Tax=Holdemanella porci TaxID=2652276 RepID=UPI001C2CB601|nr:DUF6273 domain-containing protein [Holdemanella porci]MBU9872510.1 hypothetical protein [Holdemanella porci]